MGLTSDAPVTMVNLLRFKQPYGLEHYFRYGAEIAPMLQQAGPTLRYVGSSSLYIIGDGQRPWWDIVIVEIPNLRSFLDHGDERGVSGRARPPRSGARSRRTDCDVAVLVHRVLD